MSVEQVAQKLEQVRSIQEAQRESMKTLVQPRASDFDWKATGVASRISSVSPSSEPVTHANPIANLLGLQDASPSDSITWVD